MPKSIFSLKWLNSWCLKGRYSTGAHVFAFGSSPRTNSSDGVLSNPIGGGTLAPVAKINTWLRFAL